MSFINTVIINGNTISYKEIKIKHLKTIYKCLIGETPDPAIIFLNIDNIIKKNSSLSQDEINNLSFIDYFLLLLEFRCVSIGGTIFVELINEQNTKAEIDVYKIIDILKTVNAQSILKEDYIDKFTITYQLPTIKQCIDINKVENLDNMYMFFIKKIAWDNFTINFTDYNLSTKQQILEQLPVKITASIYKKVYKIVQHFNNINLLSAVPLIKDKSLPFNFNINSLVFLLKIFFGDQLMSLYDNLFNLCKYTNFTPEYIENITPGEYFLYIKKLEKLTYRQQNREVNISSNDNSTDLFSDLPPVTSRSEFTP
jgi:hypothetical protein